MAQHITIKDHSLHIAPYIMLMAGLFMIIIGCGLKGVSKTGGLSDASSAAGVVNIREQQKWMKQTVKRLKRVMPDKCTQHIEPKVVDIEDFFMVSYRLVNQEGCITFPNGDWIYMVAHSSHDNKAIGDITMAIDNRGWLFSNEGHVCGGIIHFYTESDEKLTSVDDFFSRFLSDCDDCRWFRLNRRLQKEEPSGS